MDNNQKSLIVKTYLSKAQLGEDLKDTKRFIGIILRE